MLHYLYRSAERTLRLSRFLSRYVLTKIRKRYIIKTPNNCSFSKTEILIFYKNISFGEAPLEIILQKIFQFRGLGMSPTSGKKSGAKIWFFQIWISTCPACKESEQLKTETICKRVWQKHKYVCPACWFTEHKQQAIKNNACRQKICWQAL